MGAGDSRLWLLYAGLDTRYILDATDHVWAEYFSDAMQRWVHLDPCEAAYDQPHLYEVPWSDFLCFALLLLLTADILSKAIPLHKSQMCRARENWQNVQGVEGREDNTNLLCAVWLGEEAIIHHSVLQGRGR